jgi:hypothetical protein
MLRDGDEITGATTTVARSTLRVFERRRPLEYPTSGA